MAEVEHRWCLRCKRQTQAVGSLTTLWACPRCGSFAVALVDPRLDAPLPPEGEAKG